MAKNEKVEKTKLTENSEHKKVSTSENLEKQNKAEESHQVGTNPSEMAIKKAIADITGVDVENQKKQIVDFYGDLHNNPNWEKAVIVFSENNWRKHFSELQRSYAVSNGQTGFNSDKMGHCIIGNCLDKIDRGVRLDWYCWDIDYCYIIK